MQFRRKAIKTRSKLKYSKQFEQGLTNIWLLEQMLQLQAEDSVVLKTAIQQILPVLQPNTSTNSASPS